MAEEIPPHIDADAPPHLFAVDGDNGPPPPIQRRARDRRVLPHSAQAEMSILGGILIRPALLRHPELVLETDDFYDPRHKAVWGAMCNIDAESDPIDLTSLEVELDRVSKLEPIGGMAFLGSLALNVPTPDNVLYYARIVRDKSAARQVMLRSDEIIELVGKGDLDANQAAEWLGAELARISARNTSAPPPGTWEHELTAATTDVKAAIGGAGVDSIRPPLFDLDAVDLLGQKFDETQWLVSGLITRGGVTMIGAEPKTSKTWLGTEISLAVATGTPVCGEFYAQAGVVAYFYAEDLDRQIRNRERALLDGAGRLLGRGRFYPRPRGKFLDITRDEDLAWILASTRKLGAVDLLVLDPLRDISSAAEDKSDEMAPVMKRLKLLGVLARCTVAVVHHAGKASADTSKRRPGQRLRGSSAIHGSIDSGLYLSDLDSDEPNVFKNRLETEVKGARAAGTYDLTLRVDDDDQGEATRARWEVARIGSRKKAKERDKEVASARIEGQLRGQIAAAVASVPAGLASRNAVQKLVGRTRKSVLDLVDAMLESGELTYQDGAIRAGKAVV